ncbi:MAG: hypothetical protein AABX73_02150 [Nanoarchaeota archaeon]
MGKRHNREQLITFLALSLTHKIGSRVNSDEVYSAKYRKESDAFLKKAEKISLIENWNNQDRAGIRKMLEKRLRSELEKRDFLSEKKFDLMADEINAVLEEIGLL